VAAGEKAADAGLPERTCRRLPLPPVAPAEPRGPAWLGGDAVKAVCRRRARIAAGEQALRLGAQELTPAGADPPRRRRKTRATQHRRDRRRRDDDPESLQLTLDTHIAPAGVLPRQPFDQTADLSGKRGTTEPARPPAPGASGAASAGWPQSTTTAPKAAAGWPPRARLGRCSCNAAASRRV
jgi:hypothetical protein